MGGSVLVGADCERRSTIASEEASPKTARAKREDIFIAEARSEKQRTLQRQVAALVQRTCALLRVAAYPGRGSRTRFLGAPN